MKKFLVLLKKEIRELITIQIILPIIIMVILFAFVGNIISKQTAKLTAPQSILILNQDIEQAGSEISGLLKSANFIPEILSENNIEIALSRAQKNSTPSLMVIPSGFENNIKSFKPQQIIVYKIAENFSLPSAAQFSGMDRAVGIINGYYSNQWIQKKNINIDPEIFKNPIKTNEFTIIKDKSANVSFSAVFGYIQKQTTFIPIILFLIIILSAQMVATAVASEKENKTFEILLSSPVNRKTIIFAKLIAAGLVALLLAGIYMIGMNSYLNGFTKGSAAIGSDLLKIFASLGIIIPTIGYVLLGISLFMGILVALSIAMIIGILSENVKSIQATITPLVVLVLLPYFLVLFLNINTISPILKYVIYAIPFSHPFLASQNIILGNYAPIIYGIIYQFIVFIIFVIIGTKIFSSDKIITLKLNFGKKK